MNCSMIRNAIAVLAVALQVAGCTAMRGLAGGEPEERQLVELVGYAQRFAAMSAEEQRREYNAINQQFGKDKTASNRLRLALLLGTPGASVHDDARAAALLEPLVTRSEAASPLRSLAALLYAQISERGREQKRAEQMRDQLDELKAVERTLIERGPPTQPRHR